MIKSDNNVLISITNFDFILNRELKLNSFHLLLTAKIYHRICLKPETLFTKLSFIY